MEKINRLKSIVDLIDEGDSIADIGCDHGYTIKKAFEKNKITRALAIDINIGPLNSAKENLKKYQDKVKFYLSDGLVSVDEDFDSAIISGMGGMLVMHIIEKSFSKFKNKKLIISAQSDVYLLRQYLTSHGFMISAEKALYDNNKYYEIILFRPGSTSYSLSDLKFGPCLLKTKNEAFLKHYEHLLMVKKRAYEASGQAHLLEEIQEIQEMLDKDKDH